MTPVPYWKLWYEDGSCFTNRDGLPHESPPLGVILVTQRAQGRMDDMLLPRAQGDHVYFIWREDYGCWMCVDTVGMYDHLITAAQQITCVRPGRYVLNTTFKPQSLAAQNEIDGWQRKVE